MIYTLAVFATIVAIISGDVYMHMPRGSNNRLNEQAAQRDNANRLFDSQNNNRGGYNVGDMDPVNGFEEATYMATFAQTYDFRFLSQAGDLEKQYEELFFENSNISITWTNQHGAGNKNSDSMIVLQFICDTFPRPTAAGSDGAIGPGGTTSTTQLTTIRKHGLRTELMNGGNTNTPNEPTDIQTDADCNLETTYQGNNDANYGRRESEDFYCLCKSRQRNKGLFTADQILAGNDETYTRQNPNGNRRGLECPEERDYYPWWHPTPFHDIAVITPNVDYCNEYIAPESQNTKAKYHCVRGTVTGNDPSQWLPAAAYVEYNLNQTGCTANGGSWEGFKWDFTDSAYNPECVDSYWSRYNYLGNVDNTKRGGKMAHYDWQLPSYDDLIGGHMCYSYAESITTSDTVGSDFPTATVSINCVRMMVRLRYNISTMDYDPYKTNSTMNDDTNDGVISPVQQNPTVDVGAFTQGLRLAINTAQTGRTFQDNSHTFRVCEYPSNADWSTTDLLLNVMVRGKRGNIVQTFPAIEYDFEPQYISIKPGQCLHFQWTGSNTHNNGNPAGDGQAGDAGEGRGGSDRSNLVQMLAMDQSYPLTYDKAETDFFDYVTCHHPLFPSIDVSSVDAQLILGTGGFYRSKTQATTRIADDGEDSVMDELMNNVSASFRQGLICCVDTDSDLNGTLEVGDIEFAFLSTRNNNFTNRSQKLKIVLSKSPESSSLW